MDRQALLERVRAVLADQLAVDPRQVDEQTSFVYDLDADSLDMLQLLTAFEDEFSVMVPDEVSGRIATVRDVIDFVGGLQTGQHEQMQQD